ncbi:MAG: hypothetical protein ACJA0U_002283 [Salibacteraceae bacterium]|jgi:hypothetical protein
MRSALTKINPSGFVAIFALVFAYILFKVFNVPITHDEVATTLFYSKTSIWDIIMYENPLPNNHILNTLLTKLCLFVFGAEDWVVRIPNLLSFLLYAFGAYRIVKAILPKDSLFYIPAALLFLASHYLLDFFGLCRGYGMSVAFCTLSVSYVMTGFSNFNRKNIWYGLLFAIFASYANFTLLVFWAAITLLTWIYFYFDFKKNNSGLFKPTLLLFLSSATYLTLIAIPLYRMQSTEQFEFWTSSGFFNETILPLVMHSKYDSRIFITSDFIAWFAVVLFVLNSIYILLELKKLDSKIDVLSKPITIATLIILLTAGINILQVWILDTPNLNGRTALFFYPLFIIALISSYDFFKNRKFVGFRIGFSILMIALLIHHIVHTAKPYSVREWSYDANTLKVTEWIYNHSDRGGASLATNWIFNPSFQFYVYADECSWLDLKPSNREINPNIGVDYYYIMAEDYPLLKEKYRPVLKFKNKCWLLGRIPD